MKKPELVFIPVQGSGHLLSAIEVAKLLASQNEELSITILIMEGLNVRNPISELPQHPQLRFIQLRKQEPPPQTQTGGGVSLFYDHINLHRSHVREILSEKISSSGRTHLAGVVVDMICSSMIDVVNELGLPSYVFFPSCASFMGLVFFLQGLRDSESNIDVTEFKDSGKELAVPTYVSPVPAAVLPSRFFDKSGGCDAFLDHAKRYRKTKGILINTFRDLESHALDSLREDESIPPVYPIGPVLNLDGFPDNRREESEAVLKWLDQQPDSSVLFLCFGSMGAFPANQVAEIAVALERIGCRFLWSLRKPNLNKPFAQPEDYEDVEEALPEGFLQRTTAVGKVIGWAPQAAVLGHPAVAGFVTHCGWNSILESVWNGVPIATWPIYAEQQVNAFQLVKDMDLGVEIKMDYRKENEDVDVVSRDVIESGIRKLMDSGNGTRKKMLEMKEKSRLAISEGGSSRVSLACFLDAVTR